MPTWMPIDSLVRSTVWGLALGEKEQVTPKSSDVTTPGKCVGRPERRLSQYNQRVKLSGVGHCLCSTVVTTKVQR
jgi:hypothetical protein